jgi:hypothetical protein
LTLSLLLKINAWAMAAAGIVLFASPGGIPATVGIHIERDAYLVCYLLGAAEFAFATLCWLSSRSRQAQTLRIAAVACVVLHAASGLGELLALFQGVAAALWLNVGLRILMIALFYYFAWRRPPGVA